MPKSNIKNIFELSELDDLEKQNLVDVMNEVLGHFMANQDKPEAQEWFDVYQQETEQGKESIRATVEGTIEFNKDGEPFTIPARRLIDIIYQLAKPIKELQGFASFGITNHSPK